MKRARKGHAHEGPVVVILLRVHLLTIVLAQVFLRQTGVHLRQDGSLGALSGANKSEHESLLNSEAEHTLNVRADDLEMHQSNHNVLEKVCADLVDLATLVAEGFGELDELDLFLLPGDLVV